MKRSTFLLLVAFLVPGALAAWGYIPIYFSSSAPWPGTAWPSGAQVDYVTHVGLNPSMANLTPGSNPVAAVDAAFQTIAAASGLTMVNQGTTTVASPSAMATQNIVSYANTTMNQSLLQGGVAITTTYFDTTTGVITGFDMIGNGMLPTTTLGPSAAYDIESTIVHEALHAVGFDHDPVFRSSIYWTIFQGSIGGRTLAASDRSGLAAAYGPPPGTLPGGTVSGDLEDSSSQPIRGGALILEDVVTGRIITGGISLPDGTFQIDAVREGIYRLYADPLDGPMIPADLIGPTWQNVTIDNTFPVSAFGGWAQPTVVVVRSGQTTNVGTFQTAGPQPFNDISQAFFFSAPTPTGGGASTLETTAPYTGWIGIFGFNVNNVPDSGFSVSGPWHSITGANTWNSTQTNFDDIIFPFSIAADAAPGHYLLRMSEVAFNEETIFSGCLEVTPQPGANPWVAPYVDPSPASSGPVTLTTSGPPALGDAGFQLQLQGANAGETAFVLFSTAPDWVPLLPGFTLGVDLNQLLFGDPLAVALPVAGPSTIYPIPLPNQPALSGAEIFVQVLVTDSGSAFGAALTNAIGLHLE